VPHAAKGGAPATLSLDPDEAITKPVALPYCSPLRRGFFSRRARTQSPAVPLKVGLLVSLRGVGASAEVGRESLPFPPAKMPRRRSDHDRAAFHDHTYRRHNVGTIRQ
jgi:hypothetical protein